MHKDVLNIRGAVLEVGGRKILDDIDLQLASGEFALLLGSNGAGKSSLIRAIMGEQRLTAGSVCAGTVALIAQNPAHSTYDDLTVRENCLLRTSRDCRSHLAKLLPRLVDLYDRPVRLLSGGERQVLALALCLIDPPALLLLDEHTSALDPVTAERVMAVTVTAIQRWGITTVMTTHNLDHVGRYGSRVLALSNGKIVVDAPQLSRDEILRRCY